MAKVVWEGFWEDMGLIMDKMSELQAGQKEQGSIADSVKKAGEQNGQSIF